MKRKTNLLFPECVLDSDMTEESSAKKENTEIHAVPIITSERVTETE